MKKTVTICLSALLLLLCACGKSEEVALAEPVRAVFAEEENAPVGNPAAFSGPAAVPCSSVEALCSAFADREERSREAQFVSRGDSIGEVTATVGDVAYILRDYCVEIVRMNDRGAERLATLETGYLWRETDGEDSWSGSEKQCAALLVSGQRLVVLSDLCAFSIAKESSDWISRDSSRCTVDIYDITEPAAPRWMRGFSQSGSESGCLVTDGRLFLMTDREIYADDTLADGTLPGWWQGEVWTALPASQIYLCRGGSASYLQLGVYALENAAEPALRALVGCGEEGLLCERGLYGLIPTAQGSEVYYLPVMDGTIGEPVASLLTESYPSVSALTGAGDGLCLLQDGTVALEGVDRQCRFGEGTLTLTHRENSVELAVDGPDAASHILGHDFAVAIDADGAIYADAERGLIGLPSEDGYTLMALGKNGFSHLLDCYSSDCAGNRRAWVWRDTLFVSDRKRLFTIDLNSRKLISTLTF